MRRLIVMTITLGSVFVWSHTIVNSEEHGLGLLYEDLSTIPWFIKAEYDPLRLDPPPSVDHSADMPPVGNQGGQGSCVAWGVGYYYKTYQEWVERNWSLTDQNHQCSPAFMYNLINGGADHGANFPDACKVLTEHGCAPWSYFPYNQGNCTNWPSESAWFNALPFRSEQAYFVDCSDDEGILTLKQHLADGDNAVLGINVYSNFDNINNFDTTYCVADKYGTNRGGHAVCIVGYDDNKMTNDGPGAFRLVNSWGTGWGNQGYWWMSYVAVKDYDLSHRQACYTTDRIGYIPTLTLRFKVSHSKREWTRVFLGIGSTSSPIWTKQFFYWSMSPWQPHPFPNNNIVLDISDGIDYFNAYDTNNVFFGCRDVLSDGQTGSIQHQSSVNSTWGAFSISFETPQSIPDYGIVYVNLTLPTQQMHWPYFHCLPSNTGCTELTGNMDSVELLWSYTTGGIVESSPVIGDIDGDGKLEVVVGAQNGTVYAIDGEGNDSLWASTIGSSIKSSPCLGDIDADGTLEVVVGSSDYTVYALNGEDGGVLWSYPTGGIVNASPVLNDIDGDGTLEVVVGSSDHTVYALNGEDGGVLWSYTTGGIVESSPAIGDINGDGKLEVVIGAQNGTVYALAGKYGDSLWTYTTGGEVNSSPCLGDIDADGRLEVVVGSSDHTVYALNGEDGGVLWSYTTGGGIVSSPALGNIDADEMLEVFVGSQNSKVYALDGENGDSLWTYTTGDEVESSPCLGDIDADGTLEVVVGSSDHKVYALNGEDGGVLWSYTTGGGIVSSPALGDIDGDGDLEMVVGSNDGKIYALNGTSIGIKETGTANRQNILLTQNFPNPFTTKTLICYLVTRECHVALRVFDVTGREVYTIINEKQQPGSYQVLWDISTISEEHLPNGVYFYRLETEVNTAIKKMIICR
jgi:outer membrane protein assembly factor BamB